MRKVNIGIILCLFVVLFSSCKEQKSSAKLVINEVLMENKNGIVDEYGKHPAWIEIFNKSYGTVDLAGHIIVVSEADGKTKEYVIPKGDVLTKVAPRQHALFLADGITAHGTFHTNFLLRKEKTVTIQLLNQGGKLLDEVVIPGGTLSKNQSYGRVTDGADKWEVKGKSTKAYVSPSTNNSAVSAAQKKDKFSEFDPSGIGMALSAICVVFCGLLLLFLIFKAIGILSQKAAAKSVAQPAVAVAATAAAPKAAPRATAANGEVYAAIAMALHEWQSNVHDVESMVLTIKHVSKAWCPKTSTLREIPNRK